MPSFEEELRALGGPSFDDELAGLGGPPPDAGFKPWSGPDTIPMRDNRSAGTALWGTQNDPDASLWELASEGASDGAYATAGGVMSGAGMNPGQMLGDDVRNRLALAHERSPVWAGGGQILGEGAIQAAALPGSVLANPVVGGAAGGALSGLGNADTDDLDSRLEALSEGAGGGAVVGGALGLAGRGVSKAMGWAGDTAAPWLREQGLLNRAASTGQPVGQLSKELGGREGVIAAGQWMEDRDMTQWSPNALKSNLDDFSSMRTGDQRSFLDELAENPDAYPVDTGQVAGGLGARGDELEQLAASSAQTQGGQYQREAQNLMSKTPEGGMPFEDAWDNRKAFDTGAKWQQGAAGDQGLAEVNRDAANGMRGAMGDALDNTSPELRPRWDAIQDDLSKSLTLSGAGDANAAQLGMASPAAPMGLRSMAAAAGGGPMAYMGAVAAQTGGRGAAADALGGMSRGFEAVGAQAPKADAFGSFAGNTAAQAVGRNEGIAESGRGFLLPQAALELMRQPGSLGKWEREFFEAANSDDSHAIATLITKLSQTDPDFRQQLLPQLQQLTATGY